MKAVSVTSGGIDSITNALMLIDAGYETTLFHVNYGQKCEKAEELSVRKIGQILNVPVMVVDARFPFQTSALTSKDISVPVGLEARDRMKDIWVPARNVVFLALASAYAEEIGAEKITLGCNQSEVGYPDNTKEFLDRFTSMLEYGCIKVKPKVYSPEWEIDKKQIIEWGYNHHYDEVYKWTWSCDNGSDSDKREDMKACGHCGCCCNRRMAYYLAGISDPQEYEDMDYFWDVFLNEAKNRKDRDKFWWSKYI